MTNPVFAATYSGLVNNETTHVLSGEPDLTTSADMFNPIGEYNIYAALGTLSATNYSLSYTNGLLTVGRAMLSVIADNQTQTYGATNPVLTVHYSGFQDGDDTNILQGAPTVSTLANTNSPVGAYPIAVTLGSLSSSNYGFCFSNGVLSVTRAPLTVQANNQSRNYGSTNPALTLSYSGFVNGQDTSFIETLPLAATLADTNSHVSVTGHFKTSQSGSNQNRPL